MTQISDGSSALMQELANDALIRLQQRYPDAYELAMLASLATRIEPSLLRALRITYSGHCTISPYTSVAPLTVSSESRLWFSDIIASRSSNAISLLPTCAQQLRLELFQRSPKLCEQIRDSIHAHHRELPRELLLIEELNYLTVLRRADGKDGESLEKLRAIKFPDIKQALNSSWVLQQLSSLPTDFLPYCVQVLKTQEVKPITGIKGTNSAPLNQEPEHTVTGAASVTDNSASDDNLEMPHEEMKESRLSQIVTVSGESWIRERAMENPHAADLLRDADALAIDLLKRAFESGFRYYDRFRPFLTIAQNSSGSFTYPHAEAIEDKIDELIRGVRIVDKNLVGEPQEDKPRSFKPTAMEAMYLYAAARLRTIGLLHGLFANERTERPSESSAALLFECTMPTSPPFERKDKTVDFEAVIKILEIFPGRSSRFITNEWNFDCRWSTQEKRVLASLIQSYSPNVPLTSIPETMGDIRVRELACLLRVATVSLLSGGVCPLELRMQLSPGGIAIPQETNLATMDWIVDSYFDQDRNKLVIQAIVPPPFDIPAPRRQSNSLPLVSIDYGHSVEFHGTIMQDILDSVEPVLGAYSNTAIRSVEIQQSRSTLAEDEPYRVLPNNWLLPLASAMDGAEVAGTAAAILRSFCFYGFARDRYRQISFRDEVERVCRVIETMYPFSAIALRLVNEIRTEFDWGKEPNEQQIKLFAERMDQVMIERVDRFEQTADEAIRQGILKNPNGTQVDIVVLCHYSRCVLSVLIRSDFKGEAWLVEPATDTLGRWVPDSSGRIEKALKAANIRVRRVQAGNLFVLLSGLQGEKSLVFLAGTKGMWASDAYGEIDRFVCSVGVWNALTTVKRFRGRAIIMSEEGKTFLETTSEPVATTVAKKLQAVQQEADRNPWAQVEIVEKSLFDVVITVGKDAMVTTTSKVFISYSQESIEHSDQVLLLANGLRSQGVDCRIDRFEPYPPQGWPMWMEEQIKQADFVLLVCTDRYLKRFNGQETAGVGKGVVWESALIRNHLYDLGHDNKKFIPVGFEKGFERFIPDRLKGMSRYLLDEFTFDNAEYAALYRRLTSQDETVTPVGEIALLSPLQPQDCVASIAGIRQASQLLLRSLLSENKAAPFRYESTYAMRYLGFDSQRRQIDRFIIDNEFWMFSKVDASIVSMVKEDFMAQSHSLKSSDRIGFVLWVADPEAPEREIKNDSQTPIISVEGIEGLRRFLDDDLLYSDSSMLRRFTTLRHVLFDENVAPSSRIASKIEDALTRRVESDLPTTHAVFWEVKDVPVHFGNAILGKDSMDKMLRTAIGNQLP